MIEKQIKFVILRVAKRTRRILPETKPTTRCFDKLSMTHHHRIQTSPTTTIDNYDFTNKVSIPTSSM